MRVAASVAVSDEGGRGLKDGLGMRNEVEGAVRGIESEIVR